MKNWKLCSISLNPWVAISLDLQQTFLDAGRATNGALVYVSFDNEGDRIGITPRSQIYWTTSIGIFMRSRNDNEDNPIRRFSGSPMKHISDGIRRFPHFALDLSLGDDSTFSRDPAML
jgi:hypothetical protein